jgi:hypothetical protein
VNSQICKKLKTEISNMMFNKSKNKQIISFGLGLIFSIIWFQLPCKAADLTIEPSIKLRTVYDDNLDFESKDERDSFGGNAIPQLTLDYQTELLKASLIGQLDTIKYFTETDFDRTNHLYGFNGLYRMAPRWMIQGNLQYRRDETVDSVLQETGQAIRRKRVQTYDGGGGLFYQLGELSDIGAEFEYRRRDYSSNDSIDFDRYTFLLPYTKRFANQRDTLAFVPAYTIFDSDQEDAKDYSFAVEWERRLSETVTSQLNVGARYTDIDENNNNNNDDSLGYFGKAALSKTAETFSGEIGATRELRANSDGQVILVNRVYLKGDKRLLERLGVRFYGAAYLSDTESDEANGDKVRFFELRPALYYMLTENHSLLLSYEYQNQKEFDVRGDPVTERNRMWLGFEFKFPKKWN